MHNIYFRWQCLLYLTSNPDMSNHVLHISILAGNLYVVMCILMHSLPSWPSGCQMIPNGNNSGIKVADLLSTTYTETILEVFLMSTLNIFIHLVLLDAFPDTMCCLFRTCLTGYTQLQVLVELSSLVLQQGTHVLPCQPLPSQKLT